MLTIGIPSRGVTPSLVRVIKHALSMADVDEILVAVNPGQGERVILDEFSEIPRISFTYHLEDIGLYGNFRFLLNQATSEHFQWYCVDDEVSGSFLSQASEFSRDTGKLYVPTWFWSEYNPIRLDFDRLNLEPGVYPSLLTSKLKVSSVIYAEPSWIFGVWNTNYLKSIFPKRNFDWLDVYLLQTVILDNAIKVVEVDPPLIVGTWHWADKIPAASNGTYHNPFMAILLQIFLLPRLSFTHFSGFRLSLRRIKSLLFQSQNMNSRIRERNKQ